jgi:hypothetical protein
MVFASPAQFQFLSTAPKDDLISLSYLLVYLFKGGDTPFINNQRGNSHRQVFNNVRDTKIRLKVDDLCGPPGSDSWVLRDFLNQVFALAFDQTVDYDALKGKLASNAVKPSRIDWISSPQRHDQTPSA